MIRPDGMLAVVKNELPDPPYPGDVRSKGWRFEVEPERLVNSDTWELAGAEMRPWLLMLWFKSWQQSPAGSLPSDDVLIAARIGMPERLFRANRDILLRGWYLASDGRLYHRVITELVERMMDGRKADRDRQKRFREKKNQQLSANVTRDSRVSHGESRVSHGTGTGTGEVLGLHSPESSSIPSLPTVVCAPPQKRDGAKDTAKRLPNDWALPKAWGDWAMSQLGMRPEQVRLEAEKFRDYWIAQPGVKGRKLDWPATWRNWARNAGKVSPGTAAQSQRSQQAAKFMGGFAAGFVSQPNAIDMEDKDA
jgi:hypothetical protein